jgi:hypothetical protein
MPDPEDFDDSNEIQLTVVREPSTPPYEKGVRTRLTARTFLRIIKRIETGWPVTQSCKAEGLTYRRFRQLCQRWPTYQRRYEKAERQRAAHRTEAMEALVLRAAATNWCAAAWWLERTHPDRFSLRNVERAAEVVDIVCQPTRIIGLPSSELEKLVGDQYKQLENGSIERNVGGVRVIYARIT